jgi:hypothetical protein
LTAAGRGALARWTTALAAAAGLGAQALLQQPLAKANAVRGSRRLDTPPSSLAFRFAAGGVTEAAGDALWLTVLPSLGKPWAEPARKAAWIEAVTTVMTDANPRAHYPLVYAAYFLEMIEKRHPAIERVLLHGMEIEKRGAFGRTTRPNAEAWELPETLGMNLVLYGRPQVEKDRGISYLRTAAAMPTCPTIIIDYVAALRAREGSPLEGWDIWLLRAAAVADPESRKGIRRIVGLAPRDDEAEKEKVNRDWMASYLGEADRARLEVLQKWFVAAEGRLGRRPVTWEEVLAEAPGPTADDLRGRPVRRAALLDGVLLLPDTRDVEIPSLTKRQIEDATADLRQVARSFEAAKGRRPRTIQELEAFAGRRIPPPPRHGTRWDFDPGTGEPVVLPDPADPRFHR